MAEMKKKSVRRRIDRKVGDWVKFATGYSKYRIIRIDEEARTADLQLPHGAIYSGKRLSSLYKAQTPEHDLERMRKAQQEHFVEDQSKSRLDRPGQEDCGFKSPSHPSYGEARISCGDKKVEEYLGETRGHLSGFDDKKVDEYMEIMRKKICESSSISPMQLGSMTHEHINCRSILIPEEEYMNNTNEVVNKLNGRTKGVDLEQAVAEDKTIKVCLHTILKNCKQVKDLKLGEKAVLTGLNFNGDHFAFNISEGAVEKVENESQF